MTLYEIQLALERIEKQLAQFERRYANVDFEDWFKSDKEAYKLLLAEQKELVGMSSGEVLHLSSFVKIFRKLREKEGEQK